MTSLYAGSIRAITRQRIPSAVRPFTLSSQALADAAAVSTSTDAELRPSVDAIVAEVVVEEPKLDPETSKGGKGYRAWLNGDGAQFRHGLKGQTNWLGETPFPLNPTFSPMPPLADVLKTKIYNAYLHNILESSSSSDAVVVRAVSAKFGVGMERVRAIIRLKELEKSWKDSGKALQTELLKGMESHLGVKQPGVNFKGIEPETAPAPTLGRTKTIFEMVDTESGDTPLFLPLLSRVSPTTSTPKKPILKSSKKLVPASRPGRAGTVFTDLSGTWSGKVLEASYDQNKAKRGNKSVKKVEREEKAKLHQ